MPPENSDNAPSQPNQPSQPVEINPQQTPPQFPPVNIPQDSIPTEPPNKPFPILKLAVGIAILILVIGLAGAYYYIKFVKKTNTTESQVSTQTKSEWKLYTNKFAGYSFEYPASWFVSEKKGVNHIVNISQKDLSQVNPNDINADLVTFIEVANLSSTKTLDEEYQEATKDMEPNSFTKENTEIDGEKAIIIKYGDRDLGVHSLELIAKHSNKTISISTIVTSETVIPEKVFEHIKASFKFIAPERVASSPDQLKTKLDKYKGSDLFLNQLQFEVYFRDRKSYPKDFNELLEMFKSINHTTSNVRSSDPAGQPYKYQPLDNQADYQISTTLDDGTEYTLYGNSAPQLSSREVERLSTLSGINTELAGYFAEKKKYPNNLTELIGTYISKIDNLTDYTYIPEQGNLNYELTAVLDTGLTIYYRGK